MGKTNSSLPAYFPLRLNFFYRATLLDQAKTRWNTTTTPLWKQIEQTVAQQDLKLLLCTSWIYPRPKHYYLGTLNATLKVWSSIPQISNGLSSQTLSYLPLQSLHLITQDLPIARWTNKGIHTIGDLYTPQGFTSFQHLTDPYHIPHHDLYIYLQICHAFSTVSWSSLSISQDFLHYYNSKDSKGHVSNT